jgi:hypothetical protein
MVNNDCMTRNATVYNYCILCGNQALYIENQDIKPSDKVPKEIFNAMNNLCYFGPLINQEKTINVNDPNENNIEVCMYKNSKENNIKKVTEFLENIKNSTGKQLTFIVESSTDWFYIINEIFKVNDIEIPVVPDYINPVPVVIDTILNFIDQVNQYYQLKNDIIESNLTIENEKSLTEEELAKARTDVEITRRTMIVFETLFLRTNFEMFQNEINNSGNKNN